MKKIIALLFVLGCIISVHAQTDHVFINANKNLSNHANLDIEELPGHMDLFDTARNNSDEAPAYALIAGGSKGIGFALAEALAKRKYNLILIARGMDSLLIAKNKLESEYNVHVEVLSYDLSKEETATEIAQWCTEKNIRLKMLCNVAGLGGSRDYLTLPLDSLRYMVRLNIESMMALCLTLLPLLEKNAPSYILNVASMAGFAPIPVKNLYSATKAAVMTFSYALRYQLKKKHISVSCLAPGPVYTKPSIEMETKRQLGWFGDKMSVKPKKEGEVAISKTLKKKTMITPGGLAKLLSWVLRVVPKKWATYVYGKLADRSNRKRPPQ